MGEKPQDEERQHEEHRERTGHPADLARRALRAAREAQPEAETAAPSGRRDREPGPGDAARAALRRAMAERRSGGEGDARGGGTESDTDDAAERGTSDHLDAPTPAADTPPVLPAPGRPRSAELAREALRAARAEARRDAAEAAQAAVGRRRGPAPGAGPGKDVVGHRPKGPEQVAGRRARELRELLAGAFRMPSDEAEETAPDSSGRTEGGSGPATSGARTDAHARAEAETTAPTPPPATRTPHSMAAPSRDGELRRTFPASSVSPVREGGSFAASWWGNAWITALEEGALDVKRLVRGRSYAEGGHVDAVTVTPGLVLAYVQGSRPRPYRVQVRLRTLDDADWERFLDAAVERPGHIAALLDKELPESLADCGVPLLPGPGDLEPHCSCPDRGHPCKHAAALCYRTAHLLDADPFVLLLLRGRGERELLDALSRRNAARAARAAQEQEPAPLPGVRATDALAERRLAPLPDPLPAPAHPEQPPAYPSAPGGPDSFALDQLATDAAARAHALLTTGRDEAGELTLWQDAVRLAAARPGSGLTAATRTLYATLASATDRTPTELARAVAAWRQGGRDGLAALEEPWDPPAGRFDRARPLLLAADLPAFRPWRNHLTHPAGHVQLRLGRDGLWYAYESEPGQDDWWPRGTPDPDPVGALTGLGGSGEL